MSRRYGNYTHRAERINSRVDREQYRNEYLQSEHWKTVRIGALERAGHRCQVCNNSKSLDVHHRTYERLGEELDGDLTVLCRKCHDIFHSNGKVARTKKSKRPPSVVSLQREEARSSRQNWSKMDLATQVKCRDDVLTALASCEDGTARSNELAGLTGYRTQAIGSCLVSQRRNGLVVKRKGRWQFTAKGRAMFKVEDVAA